MSSPPHVLAFLSDLGGGEMLLIFVIVLILFGGQRLPDLARGLGKSIREFKKATAGVEEEIKRAMAEPPPAPAPRPKPIAAAQPTPPAPASTSPAQLPYSSPTDASSLPPSSAARSLPPPTPPTEPEAKA